VNRALALKLEKWAIWIALIAILFLLRHLFPIFFLTFVLSYIGNSAVDALTRRFPRRKINVAIVYAVFFGLLTGVVLLVVPRMLNEARNLARQYIASEAAREAGGETFLQREAREAVDSVIVGIAGEETFAEFRESDAYGDITGRLHASLATTSKRVTGEVTAFANQALVFAFQFVLSIIFSLLLIWDLPNTKVRLARFSSGRTAEIYREIVPGLSAFSTMLGRAFEAQSVVAVVNALLSAIVFILLGLPSIALLAMIVFVCSYIPVMGMFLSTLPAAFLALRVGGVTHVLWLVAAILVIHAIEAYMLNPLIYGRHLRLHPLAVLVILVVAEHLVGVWGLLLGVPIAAFVLKYVIEGQPVTPIPVRRSKAAPAHETESPPT
jgi:predicted PurR-regulated permease PerM